MNRILLTGASGFIGRSLGSKLRKLGFDVYGLASTKISDGVDKVCNLEDADAIRQTVHEFQPEKIIHLAALSSVTRGGLLDYYKTNVLCTQNLIGAVKLLPQQPEVLFVSTAGVYGNQKSNVLTEDMCPAPVSHYGYSKYVCERMLLSELSDENKLKIIRPFNLIGEGQSEDFIVPKLVKHFAERSTSIELGNLIPVRDYLDINDAVDLILSIIQTELPSGSIVNLCSGRGSSVQDLLDVLFKLTGHEIKISTSKKFVRTNEVWKLLGGIDKLESIVPSFQNYLIPIETSLKRMLSAYKEQGERE